MTSHVEKKGWWWGGGVVVVGDVVGVSWGGMDDRGLNSVH